jgi:hypothetical protein
MGRAVIIAGLLLVAVCPSPASALNPESPEVKKIIAKATKFLKNASDERLGGKCLIAMAFDKLGHKQDHPKIAEAIKACKAVCQADAKEIKEDIYSTGLAIVLLCELDASQFRPEIEKLLASLEHRQKSHGGWGYPAGSTHAGTGDTSMTQYGVLATWMAYRNGVEVSPESVEKVCNWLLRTQDPSGGFGYQGNDPGDGNYNRVTQSEVRNSLTAAGAGSLYICADMLNLKTINDAERLARELPPALVLVEDRTAKARRPSTDRVPAKMLTRALTDANAWMTKNFTVDQGTWNLYHLYAVERYYSFRELAENIKDDDPKWYNAIVAHLEKTQSGQGSWNASSGEAVDTAFGVLVLLRSTKVAIQKSLKRFGDGQLSGGRGLPSDPRAVTLKHGKIVGAAVAAEIDDLVAVLETGEGSSYEYLTGNPEEIKLSDDPAKRKDQVLRLRRLATAGPFESRLTAVKLLGRSRDFDSVPVLIFALSDPDARVVREAEAALRFIARRFGPSTMPAKATPEQKKQVIDAWTRWYASVRPVLADTESRQP